MIKIIVDCEDNDIVDIKCGGPETLGFDFYVNDNVDIEEYKKFIKQELSKNNLPLDNIRIINLSYTDERTVNYWTKEKIAECIKIGY